MTYEMRCAYIVRIGFDYQFEQWHTEAVRQFFRGLNKPTPPYTFPKRYLLN